MKFLTAHSWRGLLLEFTSDNSLASDSCAAMKHATGQAHTCLQSCAAAAGVTKLSIHAGNPTEGSSSDNYRSPSAGCMQTGQSRCSWYLLCCISLQNHRVMTSARMASDSSPTPDAAMLSVLRTARPDGGACAAKGRVVSGMACLIMKQVICCVSCC